MTDVEEKNEAVDEDDVTRPAAPAPSVPPRSEITDETSASNRDVDDAVAEGRGGPAALKRLAPQENAGEIIALAAADHLLGRSHSCTIPLLSATASRQHARIVGRNGTWFLRPFDGKTVIVDGRPVYEEVRLLHETKLQLGADELVFLQEERQRIDLEQEGETLVIPAERPDSAAVAVDEGAGSPRSLWIVVGCAATLVAGLAFWFLL